MAYTAWVKQRPEDMQLALQKMHANAASDSAGIRKIAECEQICGANRCQIACTEALDSLTGVLVCGNKCAPCTANGPKYWPWHALDL